MPEININFVAVFLAAAAYMMTGIIWYGPLFGKKWKDLMGYTDESMKAMEMTGNQAMIGGTITAIIMAYVLAHDAFVWSDFFGSSVPQYLFAIQLAFWIWLGYVATTQLGSVLWEGRPWKLFFINASQSLVGLIAMALILTYVK